MQQILICSQDDRFITLALGLEMAVSEAMWVYATVVARIKHNRVTDDTLAWASEWTLRPRHEIKQQLIQADFIDRDGYLKANPGAGRGQKED
jgi:hypothetical protein